MMSKTAYCFLLVIIGLALLVHACDERTDRVVIHQAAAIALHDGVEQACDARNKLRDAIWVEAASLHTELRRDEVRTNLNYEDCDELAHEAVIHFRLRLKDKSGTKLLLKSLTKGQ